MKKRMKKQKLAAILGIALAGGTFTVMPAMVSPVQAAPYSSTASVRLNGQPLATSVSPIVQNGRTLVPMRDIFESLGATVAWNGGTRSIEANRGNTNIWLQIGSRAARVGNQQVLLDQAPEIINGSTFVPLRFVSEALGANVNWNNQSRVVEITDNSNYNRGNNWNRNDRDNHSNQGNRGDNNRDNRGNNRNDKNNRGDYNNNRHDRTSQNGQQVAGMITVPRNAVVPVTLDSKLTSETARVGDTFWTTVKSERVGDSEFPPGTRLKGVVTAVSPKTKDQSGAISVSFTGMELPNGQRQSIEGSLISLNKDDVDQTYRGRIVAKDKENEGADAKTVLIGSGAGYVLGHVLLKQNSILSAALGALGGYLYGNSQKGTKAQEAVVPAGTELGVRLDQAVRYEDNYGYETSRAPYLR